MKSSVFFLCAAMFQVAAWAQEDVTNQYLTNPSFELDDISQLSVDATRAADSGRGAYYAPSVVGWTQSGNVMVRDIMTAEAAATDNNFGAPGKPSDGKQMYYIRNAWSAIQASLLQTVTLPAGKWRIAVDNRCVTQSSHEASLVAGRESLSLTFTNYLPANWTTSTLDFELSEETCLQVGLKISFGSGSGASVLIDNFRLYRLPDDYVEPEDPTEEAVQSYTEGLINSDFVAEPQMKSDLLQMLSDFSKYMVNDWYQCAAPNSIGESCGFFNGENSGGSNEQGVRPNADLSMICAFLVKYGQPAGVTLPQGVTWAKIEEMAMKSLIFAYSTHKANKLKVCSGNGYWGSTSTSDAVWESSLWAMSVAYSAYFQWDKLSDTQKNYIYKLLVAECNYELQRSIPTAYKGDTKAEENGWEADILAATLGLFPNDELAPKWFERLREFAINSYSQKDDATDGTVIDPDYDTKTVKDLYKGKNLYDDYTLQNHNYFHTSYQNVVIQELGEAALALKLFQQGLNGEEKWKTNALMHNNDKVMEEVLYWLALADGELAMPNGNDWSLFLYDQITSYSTNACFLRDPKALLLENLAYKMIKARQTTTNDGTWLLRADVGARRMGVEAHRVMMTWLMHEVLSTADLTAPTWDEFNSEYSAAKVFTSQNIVRAATDSRFTCFSWSTGLKSYTGYIAANSVDKNKIVVPFRANNTGNFLGWYEVSGKGTNATPVVSGYYQLNGNAYTMNGELDTNDATLNNRFALYSTPGNAVIYIDDVRAKQAATISAEKGGLMAISVDELTKTKRTLYTADGHKQLDGATLTRMNGPWVNIDNALGIVNLDSDKQIAFGEKANNNSIMTAKLYTSYNGNSRQVSSGAAVDRRAIVYYSNTDAETTARLSTLSTQLSVPDGWNGAIVFDPDQTGYLLLANFNGSSTTCQLNGITTEKGAPVFAVNTTVSNSGSSATFKATTNRSVANVICIFIKGTGVEAIQDKDDPTTVTLTNLIKGLNPITIYAGDDQREITLSNHQVKVHFVNGQIQVETVIDRKLSCSHWNTLCLPFSLTGEQLRIGFGTDVVLKQYSSVSGNTMSFTDATDVVAGKPYLIKPASDVVSPTFNDAEVTATEGSSDGNDSFKFVGLLSAKDYADLAANPAYLATDGSIKKLGAGGALPALSAYFSIVNPDGARILIDGVPTAIETIDGDSRTTTFYNLKGLQAEPVKNGVYVGGGKKIMVK